MFQEGWSGLRPSCEPPHLRISQTDETEDTEESGEKADEPVVSLGSTGGPAILDNHCLYQIILAIFIVRAL